VKKRWPETLKEGKQSREEDEGEREETRKKREENQPSQGKVCTKVQWRKEATA
jgi:hypothetical protein